VGADENIYEKLQEFFGLEENNINILEETIDANTQLEYFEYSQNFNSQKSEEEIIRDKDFLFDSDLSLDEKKSKLVELASLNNIEAYRTLERYVNQPNIKLYDWACMALQESRLHLESRLLDENKILITTGLGGRGLKLRYFIVLFTPSGNPLSDIQKEVIEKELNYYLPKKNAELEDILFEDSFASILAMVPLKVNLKKLFHKIITECNQMGNFLFTDFIITNVRAMNTLEIRNLLEANNIYQE
jgi:hypothetical protein